jgi:dihydroneopterin aldolase
VVKGSRILFAYIKPIQNPIKNTKIMDLVKIEGLSLQALIGVYDFERHAKQRVIVDLVMHTDFSKAGATDDVTHTIDYGKVAERLGDLADKCEFKLLEALGAQMSDMIFAEFAPEKIELTLSKPDIIDNADNVAITLIRERKS